MSEREAVHKVCEMRERVECKHTQGSVSVLYLPGLLRQRKKEAAKRKIRSLLIKGLILVTEFLAGAVAGFLTAAVVVPMAEAERGYRAVGGEWIIVIAATAATTYIFHRLTDKYW